jgi:ATP-dependent Clp protease ATP-binding subunit ClpC
VPDRPAGWLDAFDEDARMAVALAREAALGFGHNYIGSEHLLIGLIEVDGPVRAAFAGMLDSAEARLAVEQIVGRGQPAASDVSGLSRGHACPWSGHTTSRPGSARRWSNRSTC